MANRQESVVGVLRWDTSVRASGCLPLPAVARCQVRVGIELVPVPNSITPPIMKSGWRRACDRPAAGACMPSESSVCNGLGLAPLRSVPGAGRRFAVADQLLTIAAVDQLA